MKPLVSMIALAAMAMLAAGADATMCIKKSGGLVVRDACRDKETPVSTADFAGAPGAPGEDGSNGGLGPRGEKGDQGDPGGFRLLDSTGKEVGIVSIAHSDTVAVSVPGVGLGILYSDKADPSGFGQGNAMLYHEATGCQGDVLVDVDRKLLIPEVDVFADTAYFAQPPASLRAIGSREYNITPCTTFVTARGLCCHDNSEVDYRTVAPATPVPLSTIGTPPFTVVY